MTDLATTSLLFFSVMHFLRQLQNGSASDNVSLLMVREHHMALTYFVLQTSQAELSSLPFDKRTCAT
jgi:hypothetical protein